VISIAVTQVTGAPSVSTCHADVAKKFGGNPHSPLALQHGRYEGLLPLP
jgi:hypothetical protein